MIATINKYVDEKNEGVKNKILFHQNEHNAKISTDANKSLQYYSGNKSASNSGVHSWLNGNGGSWKETMRIDNTGYVGINKTNPSYYLDVAGDINFSGNLRKDGTVLSTDILTNASAGVINNDKAVVYDNAGQVLSNRFVKVFKFTVC